VLHAQYHSLAGRFTWLRAGEWECEWVERVLLLLNLHLLSGLGCDSAPAPQSGTALGSPSFLMCPSCTAGGPSSRWSLG
jgi:hypothetical protein